MKLRSLSLALCLFVPSLSLLAGGIVTNTNNSATWTRNPSTAATLGVDAVYYNPAATANLGQGLFLSLSNQSIFQRREVNNSYSGLKQSLFKGSVDAPFFPTLYAAYNVNRFSFSFGFNPIGGGGSAEFKNGLPSFEIPISDLVPSLSSQGVSGYSLDSYFKGSSVYYGYQFGVAYKLSDQVSIFAGVRYVNAKNKYEGYLKDVNVQLNGQWMSPRPILLGVSGALAGVASDLQPLAEALPSVTLAQAEGMGILPSANRAALEQGLLGLGVTQENISTMNLADVQGKFVEQSVTAAITSSLLRDQQVDVEQTGSGICPIIGANFSLLDHKLNIGLKYEFATQMEVKNKTKLDFVKDSVPANGIDPAQVTTMFPNGAKTPSDMPAILSIGVSYKLLEKLSVSGSFYYFFDKAVEYGKTLPNEEGKQVFVGNDKVIDNNFFDLGFGAEYSLTKKLLVSTGYLFGKVDVNQNYQADINHTITCHTFCFGGKYAASSMFDFTLGLSWNIYEKGKKHTAIALETYDRSTFMVGVGVDIQLSK